MQTSPPASSGMGCFARGCLALIVAAFVLVIVFVGGGLFVVNRGLHAFTAKTPVQIPTQPATSAELQRAEAKLNSLRSAVRNRQEITIDFDSNDINALIANEPEFRGARDHARVAIADSIASLDISLQLHSVHWNWLKNRWFNGNVQFGFSYVDDNFNFDLRSAEANGHAFPRILLTTGFIESFNRSFNDSFHRESSKHSDQNDFWRHIKMASLQNDKLIVTTRSM